MEEGKYIILERRFPLEFEVDNLINDLKIYNIFVKSYLPIKEKGMKVHIKVEFIVTLKNITIFNNIEEKYKRRFLEYANTFMGKLNSFFN